MSEQFDSLQEARAEIARLRQENGDLGEKCGALLAQRAHLQELVACAGISLQHICDTPTTQPLALKQIAACTLAKLQEAL